MLTDFLSYEKENSLHLKILSTITLSEIVITKLIDGKFGIRAHITEAKYSHLPGKIQGHVTWRMIFLIQTSNKYFQRYEIKTQLPKI